jgi:hypothetical protein
VCVLVVMGEVFGWDFLCGVTYIGTILRLFLVLPYDCFAVFLVYGAVGSDAS